jgi:hypothetical protein
MPRFARIVGCIVLAVLVIALMSGTALAGTGYHSLTVNKTASWMQGSYMQSNENAHTVTVGPSYTDAYGTSSVKWYGTLPASKVPLMGLTVRFWAPQSEHFTHLPSGWNDIPYDYDAMSSQHLAYNTTSLYYSWSGLSMTASNLRVPGSYEYAHFANQAMVYFSTNQQSWINWADDTTYVLCNY